MSQSQHDTIAYRLSQILIKLNQGDRLDPDRLAEEFGVHIRTIQRDLKVRLSYLPLIKTRGLYHLDPAYLGKLGYRDIERFATLAGVKGLFPTMGREFLRELLDERIKTPWLVRGHHYEDMSSNQAVFTRLEECVVHSRQVDLEIEKDGATKHYSAVSPYRLVNTKGIWYLAAVHEGKFKTFGIGKIRAVDIQEHVFKRDPAVDASIQTEEGVWHSNKSIRVLLAVSPEVAPYFKRRQLIPHQKLLSESADGALMIESSVGHPNQILPIVRYWIPGIRILEPCGWQETLEKDLTKYLGLLT